MLYFHNYVFFSTYNHIPLLACRHKLLIHCIEEISKRHLDQNRIEYKITDKPVLHDIVVIRHRNDHFLQFTIPIEISYDWGSKNMGIYSYVSRRSLSTAHPHAIQNNRNATIS